MKSLPGKLGRAGSRWVKRGLACFAPKSPVHVFHHIPKCGGTSVRRVVESWFLRVLDYRSGWTLDYPPRVDLESLGSLHCLCGHWELDGFHLHQRYPEVFRSERFKVFTFVRHPLQVQLSLYRAETLNGVAKASSIEEHLRLRPNYLANRFPANEENYREVLDRYIFVGVLENAQLSLDLLAEMVGRPPRTMPWRNKKRNHDQPGGILDSLSPQIIRQFEKENALDYAIYQYCAEKLKRRRPSAPLRCDPTGLVSPGDPAVAPADRLP